MLMRTKTKSMGTRTMTTKQPPRDQWLIHILWDRRITLTWWSMKVGSPHLKLPIWWCHWISGGRLCTLSGSQAIDSSLTSRPLSRDPHELIRLCGLCKCCHRWLSLGQSSAGSPWPRVHGEPQDASVGNAHQPDGLLWWLSPRTNQLNVWDDLNVMRALSLGTKFARIASFGNVKKSKHGGGGGEGGGTNGGADGWRCQARHPCPPSKPEEDNDNDSNSSNDE